MDDGDSSRLTAEWGAGGCIGMDYDYVSILSFVDKDRLEPGCLVLLNHKVAFRLRKCVLLRLLCSQMACDWMRGRNRAPIG